MGLTKEQVLAKIAHLNLPEGSKIAVSVIRGRRDVTYIGEYRIKGNTLLLGTKCKTFDFFNIQNIGRVVDEKRRLICWVS